MKIMSTTYNDHSIIFRSLLESLSSGTSVHAFVFAGGSQASREDLAALFAKAVTGDRREDIIYVSRRQGKAGLGVEDAEDLIGKLAFKPYGERYAVVIPEAHLLNAPAQNKLLKTLEEPVSPAVIMLLAENRDALLRTVLSRCSVYQLREPETEADEEVRLAADMMLSLCREGASFYRKKNVLMPILQSKEDQRERGLAFIAVMEEIILKEAKAGDRSCLKAIPWLREARKALKQVHNTAYTLKKLCLYI